jgi:hypothetical protein
MRSVFRSWRDWRHVASIRGKNSLPYGVSGKCTAFTPRQDERRQIEKRLALS